VIAWVDGLERGSFDEIHARVRERIDKGYGFALDQKDRKSLERTHKAFFEDGLGIHFTLKEESFRKYPPLRELLLARDPSGAQSGFLASEDAFRFVQTMERENRIVPLVGDFAGEKCLLGLAKHLEERGQKLGVFYVSNVEQYLLADGVWWKWRRNVAAFPVDGESLFVRAYLDQGKPHPQQLPGHRTTSTLHRIVGFNEHTKPDASMLALATEGLL
jgi:hypothetical protein